MSYEYTRIQDTREATFDSLEHLCNNLALEGWRVIHITDDGLCRSATLERLKPVASETFSEFQAKRTKSK